MLSWSGKRLKDPWMAQDLPGNRALGNHPTSLPSKNYILLNFTSNLSNRKSLREGFPLYLLIFTF